MKKGAVIASVFVFLMVFSVFVAAGFNSPQNPEEKEFYNQFKDELSKIPSPKEEKEEVPVVSMKIDPNTNEVVTSFLTSDGREITQEEYFKLMKEKEAKEAEAKKIEEKIIEEKSQEKTAPKEPKDETQEPVRRGFVSKIIGFFKSIGDFFK